MTKFYKDLFFQAFPNLKTLKKIFKNYKEYFNIAHTININYTLFTALIFYNKIAFCSINTNIQSDERYNR